MELRYLKGKTQMEVAREIGISQAQVSRLEKGALEQFRTDKQKSGTGLPAPLSYFLYLRLVAAPPRRWRSALLRASTACTAGTGLHVRSRTDTSLCTVDLLHPNARAAARTVALCSAMYSPSSAARCSGSTFIRSRLPCLRSP